jgi:hypothetical protein
MVRLLMLSYPSPRVLPTSGSISMPQKRSLKAKRWLMLPSKLAWVCSFLPASPVPTNYRTANIPRSCIVSIGNEPPGCRSDAAYICVHTTDTLISFRQSIPRLPSMTTVDLGLPRPSTIALSKRPITTAFSRAPNNSRCFNEAMMARSTSLFRSLRKMPTRSLFPLPIPLETLGFT